MSEYDVIVVGGGAAGGIVAGVLSEAGKRVLLLERGRNLSFADEKRDHLRNHRFGPYGHNTGPDLVGNPRVTVDENGRARIVNPIEGGYENNAMCVGGGTLIWGMQSWRFAPTDFRMASHYGVPEGSSLADWPISYDDLEPYYERAEWQVGVAGDASKLTHEGYRKREFPMPAVPDNPSRLLLTEGAKSLGWKSHPVPLAINSVPYNGRQACIQCAECVGYQCPTDAKNGSRNTLFVRAIASGNCTVVTQAIAEKIETDSQGHVTGVSYFVDHGSTVERVTASASQVVVSGGAVESARLLLNSKSDMHPNGLGNANDQVGRNFFGHIYTGAYAQMPTNVIDGLGPGVTIGTTQFVHDNPGIVGGGLLANEFIKTPIHFVNAAMAPEVAGWGAEHKRWVRENFQRVVQVCGPCNDIPMASSRIEVDPAVRDKYGIPVVRRSGHNHPDTLKTADFLRHRAEDWLRASGAEKVWSTPNVGLASGGQHQAGTCRMGDDPKSSVTDKWGRVHGHDNLFVVDGSLHVTAAGFNPALTIMALAFRSAELLAKA